MADNTTYKTQSDPSTEYDPSDPFETTIFPTRAEKTQWKKNLYNTCKFLATERPELAPRKKDSLNTLLETFLYWAHEYNDGYFIEREDAPNDRYAQWLVEQYAVAFAYENS